LGTIYPFIFDPSKFENIIKEGFKRKLNENGIPTDDCYPPLRRLTCFRESLLREKIDYTQANWGGNKSDDALFPVVSDIYERSIQLPHYVLLADRGELDYIAQTIVILGEGVVKPLTRAFVCEAALTGLLISLQFTEEPLKHVGGFQVGTPAHTRCYAVKNQRLFHVGPKVQAGLRFNLPASWFGSPGGMPCFF
jgi:hypothetical protein